MILIRKIRTIYKILLQNRRRRKMRRKIKNRNFSIISNNCWGGGVYEELGLPYLTPTIGLFLHGPCYIKFIKNLNYYFGCELIFTATSKYQATNTKRDNTDLKYPIGKLADIEIHFLHYHSEDEAFDKWNRRKARVNFDNLFVELGEIDLVDKAIMEDFNSLEFPNKVLFSVREDKNLNSLVFLRERKGFTDVGDIYTHKTVWMKEFDVVEWLNKGLVKNKL